MRAEVPWVTLGAATDPDMNSQFWNPPSMLSHIPREVFLFPIPLGCARLSTIFSSPTFPAIIKLGSGDNQALSATFRYFSLGEVTTGEYSSGGNGGGVTQTINPYEMALDIGYSRKLSSKFSMGVVLRYILSDLAYQDLQTGEQNNAAHAFSVDLSGYYTTFPMIGRNECQFSWGFDLSNIGTKVSYDNGTNNAFPAGQSATRS